MPKNRYLTQKAHQLITNCVSCEINRQQDEIQNLTKKENKDETEIYRLTQAVSLKAKLDMALDELYELQTD